MEIAVIMGAGPAGLTAAYELLTRTNIKPILIEPEQQVGGLSRTINYKGNLIDIGGHRFFSKSEKIIDWWLQFLPLNNLSDESIPINYQGKSTRIKPGPLQPHPAHGHMLIRPRKSRIYYDQVFFDYPLRPNARTIRNFGAAKMARIMGSYLHAKLFPISDRSSLETFFINRFGRELYSTFFKGYTEKIWGVPCTEIPADWGHQRIRDLNIGKAIVQALTSPFRKNKGLTQQGTSTSLIEQFLYPERGPGQLWEAVADEVVTMGGEIRFGEAVDQILVESESRIESVIVKNLTTGHRELMKANYFFSTMPVKDFISEMTGIAIPEEIIQIANGLRYRDFMIVGLLFRKPANKQQSTLAALDDNWIYLQDPRLTAGRMQIFNNWSPYMVTDPDTVWVGLEYFCNTADAIWNKSDKELIQFALAEMNKTGLIHGEEMLDATVIRVPKAYPSYIGTYDQFPKIQSFLDQFENLYLIGRNGMHRYNNSDHSMMTAMQAVDNLVNQARDRKNIWDINMEQEFHEERIESEKQ
ncbi:MAG TPA: NAD(P)/FAD-dependent oxidoreductase [Puia sp.]|nr:NAD(P)/FAD-dependent oxidoreductase [Puia sp.]